MKEIFLADELSELENTEIRGGIDSNSDGIMAQKSCTNKADGCGTGTQDMCTNTKEGCGSTVDQGECINEAGGCG